MSSTPCIICELRNVFMYLRVPGTDKFICVPCCDVIAEAKKKYIGDVIHKAKKHPAIHEHRKIESPDEPSENML